MQKNSMQEQPEDIDNDEGIALDEASSSGHVVNTYQCSQAMLKMNTKKQPQNKNDRYNLRCKGDPPTLGEVQEKVSLILRKVDPPVAPK